ncbi:MAG: VRR-NUC domain-containing protein [Planctomycetota bacterium]
MDDTTACRHDTVDCLNPYELIRKYRCVTCDAVMMCSCEEEFAQRFLPHQLSEGRELSTQTRIPVTHGFQAGTCRECRGLPAEAHPMSAIPGRTSKIRRYYWREIDFEVMRRCHAETGDADLANLGPPELRKRIEREVVAEIKQEHESNPKYTFESTTQADIIRDYSVEVERIDAAFAPKQEGKKAAILDGSEECSAEEFASRHFRREGWESLRLESAPFHVIFGVYFWTVIQDPADERCRMVQFGSRTDYEGEKKGVAITTWLPEDFGTPGYPTRRSEAIDELFDRFIMPDTVDYLFEEWLEPSQNLREYLWAHRVEDVERAQKLVEILPPEVTIRILRYLVADYWRNYVGWPDLLLHRGDDYFFAEVKASRDKLSDEQKSWIRNNHTTLKLPFRLVKIHRASTSLQGRTQP